MRGARGWFIIALKLLLICLFVFQTPPGGYYDPKGFHYYPVPHPALATGFMPDGPIASLGEKSSSQVASPSIIKDIRYDNLFYFSFYQNDCQDFRFSSTDLSPKPF